jgi:hypothetical protein
MGRSDRPEFPQLAFHIAKRGLIAQFFPKILVHALKTPHRGK